MDDLNAKLGVLVAHGPHSDELRDLNRRVGVVLDRGDRESDLARQVGALIVRA